jgi:predicted nucleotidyltransferase
MGLLLFLGIQEYLENLLGRPVDLVIRDDLKPRIRDRVLREAVPIPLGTPAAR